MKILMLHNKDLSEKGGVAEYIYGLSRQLCLNGNKVYVICLIHDKKMKDYENLNGIHLHRLYIPFKRGLIGYIYRYIWLNIYVIRLHNKINFDLICFHTPIMYATLKYNKILKEIPLVYTLHMSSRTEMRYEFQKLIEVLPVFKKFITGVRFLLNYYIYSRNEKSALKKSKYIIVTTNFVRKILEEEYGDRYLHKISVLPPGVDLNSLQPLVNKEQIKRVRRSLELPEDAIVFFTLRRLSPRMGLENLIKAIVIVRDRIHNFDKLLFLIGGKGVMMRKLQSLIEEYDLLKSVKLLGFLSEEKKVKYLQASDCAILPTEDLEGFGIFTIESLASGLPVIGTPVGGTVELLSHVKGGTLLTKDTTPEAIADKIVYFLKNIDLYLNPDEYINLVRKRYTWDKIAVEVEDVYRKSIDYN